ncbi:MAG: hypothetical protein ABWZ40_14540 [Caulobacterales bacterium]
MERHFPATARDLRHAEGVGGPLQDAAEIATDVLKARVTDAKAMLQPTIEKAEESFGKATAVVVDKIRERPVTAAVAAVGVGMIIGLMLNNSRRR